MSRSLILIALAAALAGCGGKPKTMSADQTVKTFAQAMAEQKPGVVWELLPPSYQNDINSVVSEAAAKADPDLHSKGTEVFGKLVGVLKDKKPFILGLPMLQQIPNVDPAKLTANYDSLVSILETIKSSELNDLNAMKKADVGKFLKGPGTTVMGQIGGVAQAFGGEQVSKQISAFNTVQTKVTSESGTSTKMEVTYDGKTKPVELVLVEERWVPAEMANEWSKQIASAKEDIAKTDPAANKLQVLGMMGGATAVLDQLAKAQTQEEFTQMLMSGLGPIMGGMQ
jgi:hypothetical protein